MLRVNLIPAHRVEARRVRHCMRVWAAASGAFAGLLLFGLIIVHVFGGVDETSLRNKMDRTISLASEIRGDVGRLGSTLSELDVELAAHLTVASQPDWSILLAVLAEALGPDIMLSNVRLGSLDDLASAGPGGRRPSARRRGTGTNDDLSLLVSGLGVSQPGVSQFAIRLEETGLFGQVKMIDTHLEPYQDGNAVAFTLVCRLGTGTANEALER